MSRTPDEQPTGDYSYDMAHEASAEGEAAPGSGRRSPAVEVSTGNPADEGGDYSYDLAHDIPPAGG